MWCTKTHPTYESWFRILPCLFIKLEKKASRFGEINTYLRNGFKTASFADGFRHFLLEFSLLFEQLSLRTCLVLFFFVLTSLMQNFFLNSYYVICCVSLCTFINLSKCQFSTELSFCEQMSLVAYSIIQNRVLDRWITRKS